VSGAMTLGLAVAVLLIVALLLMLVFHRTPSPKRVPHSVAGAFHRMLLGDRAGAREILSRCIQDPQASPEAFLHLGNLLREEGKADRALSLHQGILARPRIDPAMRRLVEVALADDLLELGRNEEAQGRLEKLEDHFLDEVLLERRAWALHRLGRYEEAAEVWLRRVRLDPTGPAKREAARYLAELAREEQLEGKSDRARDFTKKARQLDSGVATAAAVEGDLRLADGDGEAAFQLWMEGLEEGDEGREALLPRLLDLAMRLGRMDNWIERLDRLHAERPDDAVVWRAVTDLRLRRGDRQAFFGLVESAPSSDAAPLSTWAGWIRYLEGRGDEEGLRRLMSSMPDALGPRAWVCTSCGEAEREARQVCFRCGRAQPLLATGGAEAVVASHRLSGGATALLPEVES
jgi:lipopolysaccharide biosynthesis regulator YciM